MNLSPINGKTFAAMLFDMDGTILNSIGAAEAVWATWARSKGVPVATFLPTIHGRKAVETIASLQLPGVDPLREAEEVTAAEIAHLDGVCEIPGAGEFLRSLPPHRWAVVTSAPTQLALTRMAAAGLPLPQILVAAEDVQVGKPAPDGYQLAAARLGVAVEDCLIFEDAEAGILAAQSAGGTLVVVTATHRTQDSRQYATSVKDPITCHITDYQSSCFALSNLLAQHE